MSAQMSPGGGLLTDEEDAERKQLKTLVKNGKASAGEQARFEELKERYRGSKDTRVSQANSLGGIIGTAVKGIVKNMEQESLKEKEAKIDRELMQRLREMNDDELLEHAKNHRSLEARVQELEHELGRVRKLNTQAAEVPELKSVT